MNNEEEFTPRVITLKVTEYRYVAEMGTFSLIPCLLVTTPFFFSDSITYAWIGT